MPVEVTTPRPRVECSALRKRLCEDEREGVSVGRQGIHTPGATRAYGFVRHTLREGVDERRE
jgi:hypothetical protein